MAADQGAATPLVSGEDLREECVRGCRLDIFSSRACAVCGQRGLAYDERPEDRLIIGRANQRRKPGEDTVALHD